MNAEKIEEWNRLHPVGSKVWVCYESQVTYSQMENDGSVHCTNGVIGQSSVHDHDPRLAESRINELASATVIANYETVKAQLATAQAAIQEYQTAIDKADAQLTTADELRRAYVERVEILSKEIAALQGQIIYKDEQHSMTVAAHDEALLRAFEMGADWALCGFRSKDGLAEAEARRLLSQNLLGKP